MDDELNEFVVCPSCGTRIKAGREFCLRCFGPLPTAERPAKAPIWVSLGLSDTKKQIVAAAVAAVVIGLGVVIYFTEPAAVDETARPAAAAVTPRPATAPQDASATQPAADVATPPASTGSAGVFEPAPVSPSHALDASERASLEAKRSSYESQLASAPQDATLLNDLGLVLDELGRSGEAIPRFERAIELSPEQPNFHLNLAHAAVSAGLWNQAVSEYREAARLRPDDFLSQLAVAVTLHRKADDEAAIPEFHKALKISPNNPTAHLALGVSLEIVGRVEEAVQSYRRYLSLQPKSPDAERLRDHLAALGADKAQP